MSVSSLIIGRGDSRGRVPIHCDDNGDLYFIAVAPPPGSGAAPINSASAAKEKSLVVSAAPAVLFSVNVANPTALDVFILLFDAAALPGNNEVPIDYAVVPAGWVGGFSFGELGREFSNGIVVAASSTLDSLTLAAGADYLFSARYV